MNRHPRWDWPNYPADKWRLILRVAACHEPCITEVYTAVSGVPGRGQPDRSAANDNTSTYRISNMDPPPQMKRVPHLKLVLIPVAAVDVNVLAAVAIHPMRHAG